MTGSAPDRCDERPFFDEMLEQIQAAPPPARVSWRRRHVLAPRLLRPLPMTGAGIAVASSLAALVIALGAGGGDPPPARAVSVDANNNTVTIFLTQFRDLGKLNARLAALHTRIRAVPVVPGCVAPVHVEIGAYRALTMHRKPGPAPGPPRTLEVDQIFHVPGAQRRGLYMTIGLWTAPGRTLILPVTRTGMLGSLGGIGDGVVAGPAPRCVGDNGLHGQRSPARSAPASP